jgi:GT2 family glycosyltransferase
VEQAPAGRTAPGDGAGHRILFAPRILAPPRADAAHDPARYAAWRAEGEAAVGPGPAGAPPGDEGPVVAVLVVVRRADPALLGRCLDALVRQTLGSWVGTLGVAGDPGAAAAVLDTAAVRSGGRAGVTLCEAGTGDPEVLEQLRLGATADHIVVVGAHDVLAPHALERLVATASAAGAAAVYSDEDRIDADGARHHPQFKPDWSPELLLSAPYVGGALLVRRDALDGAGGFAVVADGSWEHDLFLRIGGHHDGLAHLSEIAYSRAAPAGGAGDDPLWPPAPGAAAPRAALARSGSPATVVDGPVPGSWTVHRRPAPGTRASVIVPFRDGPRLLRTCVDTVSRTADGVDLELLLVDNGSEDPETLSLVERYEARPDVTVLRDPRPFNWPALNNAAARQATGDVLVFLNNDVEARRPGWLAQASAQALRADVGAVGARLLYPDGRVQHAGVVVGLGGAAGHVLAGIGADEPGYLAMAVLARDCLAVTGACLATRRSVFEELDGFDVALGLDLNDIDYCLRARDLGYRTLYDAGVELVHHESPSRGTSGSVADISRFLDRWNSLVTGGDPYLNAQLTRVDSSCALRGPDEDGWWLRWRSTLDDSTLDDP